MYNDFVLIGPVGDPAGISGRPQRRFKAMQNIARTEALFVSRGDDSGTHKAELAIWRSADLDPANFGEWYKLRRCRNGRCPQHCSRA